jgi:uncharacterized protein (TIGR02246 family)
MKVHILPTLALLAFGFVVPAPGQENNTVDPQVRKQVEELNVKYDKAFNQNDAAAITALFTWDGVETGPEGQAFGQPDIEERYGALFQLHPIGHLSKLIQVYAIGSRVCAITEWTAMLKKDASQPMRLSEGYIVTVNVREGDIWKIEMLYSS